MYKKIIHLKKWRLMKAWMKRKKEMISMLQQLPAAMPFPSSSRSKTRYKAWCTVRNHAYGDRKKNIETLILKHLSETFIICLWNMWKQLMQHELGEHWLSGKIILEHLKFKFETFSFLAWNIVVVWNKKCSETFLIQVWNISNLGSQHLT
jgi:hypothetical protein